MKYEIIDGMAHGPTISAYDKIADEFHYRLSPLFWDKEYQALFELLPEGGSVLDIGCGIGRDASHLAEKYSVTGIDASVAMLEIAKRNNPQSKFFLQDFYALDFPDDSFDGFWAAASLLHAPKSDMGGILGGIRRIVRDGGVGFISLKEKRGVEEGIIKSGKFDVERYFAFYEKREFKVILESNAFEVMKITEKTEDDSDKTHWLCYFVRVLK